MIEIHSHNLYEHKPLLLKIYRADPLKWYVERWGGKSTDLKWSDYPEYAEHEWDGTVDPLLAIFRNVAKGQYQGVEAATSVGKTWLLSIICYWYLDVYRGGTVYCLGNSETDLKDTLWAELQEKFNHFQKLVPTAVWSKGGTIICDNESLENAKWKLRLRGTKKKSKEESSGSVQGRHGKYMLFLLDEMAKIEPSVITGVDQTCSDRRHNIMLGAGNPDSQVDGLHQFIQLPYVQGIRISGLDHPNIVCGEIKIHGAVSPKSIEDNRAGRDPDDPFVLSRTQGISPADSKNSLIKKTYFEQARNFDPPILELGNSVGIDVANSEKGDKAAVYYMQGQVVHYGKPFVCKNANAIANNLMLRDIDLTRFLTMKLNRKGEWEERENPLPNYDLIHLPSEGVHPWEVAVDITGVGVGTSNEFLGTYDWEVFSFIAGGSVMGNEGLLELIPKRSQSNKPAFFIVDMRTLAFMVLKWDLESGEIGFSPDFPEEMVTRLHVEASAHRLAKNDKGIKLIPKVEVRKNLMGNESPNNIDALAICNLLRKINKFNLHPEAEPGRQAKKSTAYAGVDW